MTETDRPHSGSRWEPSAPPSSTPEPVTADLAAAPAAPVRRLPARLRKRTALAGAAVGLVAIGGLGGIAAGHETGRDSTAPARVVQGGTPDGAGQNDPGQNDPGQNGPGQEGSGQSSGPDADDGGSGGDTGDDA